MYEQISIQGFRGIKELVIDKLAPINILIGNNGSGKSSVLEALWLHSNPNQTLVTLVDNFRGYSWEPVEVGRSTIPWKHLFFGFELQSQISISGQADNQRWSLRLRQTTESDALPPIQINPPESSERLNPLSVGRPSQLIVESQEEGKEPVTPSIVVTPQGGLAIINQPAQATPIVLAALLTSPSSVLPGIALRFGRIDRENKQGTVLKLARILEPHLERLSVVPRPDGRSDLYADIRQKELLPVQLIGGGFVNVVCFATMAVDVEGGLLLIDEIENGIHYSALEPLWKGIWGLCTELGVQIVATTHSLECVEAARAVLPPEAFLVHRLERNAQTGSVRVGSLDAEMLEGAANMGVEVR